MIKVTYDNGFGFTACLYDSLDDAMADIKDKEKERCWSVYSIEEVER